MVSVKTKSALIAGINTLLGAVGDKFEADDDGDAERDFMVERCPKRLEATIRSLPTLSVHLLAVIADGPVSVVGLAARSDQLKGTVSKHVQRLVAAGLVERRPIPGNRKEIELIPTPDGSILIDAHRRMHDEKDMGLQDFLRRYTSADLQVIDTVLRDLLTVKRVGVRIVVDE
jgi:DNA-binding MarR family transcriptional regulator